MRTLKRVIPGLGEVDGHSVMEKISRLSKEHRDHFAATIALLATCYDEESRSRAVILVDRPDDMLHVVSLNANELDVAELIQNGATLLNLVVMEDAPPKELFN